MYIFNDEDEVQEKTKLQILYGDDYFNVEDSGLMYVAGVRGSYKSTFCRVLAAAALNKGKPICNFLFNDFGDKKVLIIDTEQAPALIAKGGKALLKLLGLKKKPRNLDFIGLSGYTSWMEKKAAFRDLLEETENVGLIILDNPRDLLGDSSSAEESKKLMDELNAYAVNNGAFVVCVSHLSDSAKMNGHVKLYGHSGTALNNAASCGFVMIKLKDSVIVSGHKDRWGFFPDQEFAVTEESIPMPYPIGYCPFTFYYPS